ncbi:MAG: SPASM domain-containing protein [Candidatus Eremiobacteraeota bacterium]|nr:SPASM domain-containing protein [Candidatus Eremiobacteraeota bacterium]
MTLSTNGTLIDRKRAQRIRNIGFSYVGISIDGIGSVNDLFRGKAGAFKRAVAGISHCKAVGQKVGLRLTLTPHNADNLDAIFDFIEYHKIERACFYHLVPAGRGRGETALSPDESRRSVQTIFRRTRYLVAKGDPREILTVDNHADAPFLYMTLLREDPVAAKVAYKALAWNGGGRYSSGVGIADIDPQGNVHPDQFWQSAALGNVRLRKFSEIWTDPENHLLAALRDRLPRLKGRCGACRFQNLCGGNFRVRALAATGDMWAPDPGCYLTDDEVLVAQTA